MLIFSLKLKNKAVKNIPTVRIIIDENLGLQGVYIEFLYLYDM
jgi:hypothetical protein